MTSTGRLLFVRESTLPAGVPALPAGYRSFDITEGYSDARCSCSLYRLPDDDPPREPWETVFRRRAERKGWSEARILRARSDHRRSCPEPEEFAGLRPDIRALIKGLAGALPLAVFVHDYSGKSDPERVRRIRTISISIDRLVTNPLALQPDCLTWVESTRG